jgi:hypothetical protein
MPQDWDVYMARIDGQPGFGRLDLGLIARAPDAAFPLMAYLRIHLNDRRDNGFPTEGEFAQPTAIEKTLAEMLAGNPDMIDTGVVTTDGFRDLIFYGPTEAAAARLFEQVIKRHPSHRFETGTMHDPARSYYREFLYPDVRTRQTMNNCKVYATLAEKATADMAHARLRIGPISRPKRRATSSARRSRRRISWCGTSLSRKAPIPMASSSGAMTRPMPKILMP